MNIIRGFPPNYELLASIFPIRGRATLFAWGDSIYATNNAEIRPQKIAHEFVHSVRQKRIGIESWWDRYIAEKDFRFAEEVAAHIAEYLALCEGVGRGARRAGLTIIARQLASPIYGGLISCERAKRVILEGASAARSQVNTNGPDGNRHSAITGSF